MKIYIITPIYASTTKGDGATPLVHYFAREWVRMGHDVTVFNFMARFPRPYYWVGKMFQHQFNSRLGMLVPTHCPRDEDFVIEGVKVIRKTLTKYKPHTEYTHDKTEKALDVVRDECMKFGIPDYFIGHWDSPWKYCQDLSRNFINQLFLYFIPISSPLRKDMGIRLRTP